MWKIKKVVSKGDYNYAVVSNHPNATKHGYVLEHRIIMENYLGRLLNHNEVIHHKDGNKKNNHVDNLEVMTISDHARHHSSTGRSYVKLKCPFCSKLFVRAKNKTHLVKHSKATFCSRRCNGKFKTLETHKVDRAISENVVLIFKR